MLKEFGIGTSVVMNYSVRRRAMSKSQVITLVVIVLFIPACASSPVPRGLSAGRPASIDCRRIAPTGSKIKSKTVCGRQGGGQSVMTRKQYDLNRDPRDVFGIGRMHDNL